MAGLIPDTLWKYSPWNEYARRVVTHRELWYSNPTDFNDPFDCQGRLVFEGSSENRKRTYVSLRVKGGTLTRRQAEREFEGDFGNRKHDADFWVQVEKDAHRRLLENFCVCCLSEKNDDILMWSHYSKDHTGVCFGFRTGNDHFQSALQVMYQSEFPVIKRIGNNHAEVSTKVLCTKSDHWKYEKEWRLVHFGKFNGVFIYPIDCLDSIIIGCRAKQSAIDDVLRSVDEAGLEDVKVVQARVRDKEYGLEVPEQNHSG